MALTHEEATALLAEIGAIEHGSMLKDILGNIEQTFGGQPLYPTAECRVAHLLYFIVKNHALLDGTKRGAEAIFGAYLSRNDLPALPPQLVGRLLNEIEKEHGRAHQERIVALITDEFPQLPAPGRHGEAPAPAAP